MTLMNPTQPALAAAAWPVDAKPAQRALRFALLAILGVIFVALCSQVRVPFYPVPMTGQTFATLLVGAVFGWRLGIATLALYIGAGAIGIPVFSNWMHGPGVIAGATGGYIIGFALAAGLIGYLANRGWTRSIVLTVAGMLAANVVIYVVGVPWLAVWYGSVGAQYLKEGQGAWDAAFASGVVPFLLGDLLKLLLAAAIVAAGWRLFGRKHG
ncbi:MAG: biotin transporter BioY [Alphaproteobacteria bacterium]